MFELRYTAKAEKIQGEVARRLLTVVTAPSLTPNAHTLLKQDTILSLSFCDPGPHAVLLVMPVYGMPMSKHRKDVEQYISLLSEDIWSHTIVLFTCGDQLGDTGIEQYIKSQGEHLRWLMEKCGNRYHLLNNQDRGDVGQVTELLEKIEDIVAGNGGRHYEMDRGKLEEVKRRREKEIEGASERLMKVKEERSFLQSLKRKLQSAIHI